jgi:diacylglycerol kinase family enzyme
MLDDGLLDVGLLPQLPREEISEALRIVLRDGLEGVRRTLVRTRLPWLEVETGESLQINLDGEPLTDTRFRFDILPRRIVMKLPAGCPLVA